MGLAIDDFGTGYSSLMQLRQLPFTEVKIDKCFVKDLPEAHDSRLIARTITELAHGLGLVAAPRIRSALAAAAGLLLTAERTTDLGSGGTDVDVRDAAIRTGRREESLR